MLIAHRFSLPQNERVFTRLIGLEGNHVDRNASSIQGSPKRGGNKTFGLSFQPFPLSNARSLEQTDYRWQGNGKPEAGLPPPVASKRGLGILLGGFERTA